MKTYMLWSVISLLLYFPARFVVADDMKKAYECPGRDCPGKVKDERANRREKEEARKRKDRVEMKKEEKREMKREEKKEMKK